MVGQLGPVVCFITILFTMATVIQTQGPVTSKYLLPYVVWTFTSIVKIPIPFKLFQTEYSKLFREIAFNQAAIRTTGPIL